ncbi:MAG: FtsX-like permease family protein [Bacteroidales bacterium]|nr:FtsX-like permease family protein [Bacteroidales bacterium]
MFYSYLRSAFRSITRNRFYAFINIAGLSAGIITALFLMLYVWDELSFDQHNNKYKRIYRIESDFTISGKHDRFALAATPMGPAFKLEFPEVESFVRLYADDNIRLSYENNQFTEKRIFYADSTLFSIFDHTFIYGNPDDALKDINSIVMTQSMALKYFGDKNPIGLSVQTEQKRNLKVTGVVKDCSSNSHLKFDGLISTVTIGNAIGTERFNSMEPVAFWNLGAYTYILLNENSNIQQIHDRIPAFYTKFMEPVGKQINASFNLMTTRLDSTHHREHLMGDLPTGNKSYVWIFLGVSVFILLLAAINYMNMATARSSARAREVGIRKVVGGHRLQIMSQFFGESMLLSVISTIIALALLFILLPSFNQLSGKELSYSLMFKPFMLSIIAGIAIITGIISGAYPALYLSSFEPMVVLRGTTTKGRSSKGFLRKTLVVFQFVISIIMIMASITVAKQIYFLQNKELGFEKENVMICELTDSTFRKKAPVMRNELLKNPHVLEVSTSNGIPGSVNAISVVRVEQKEKMQDMALNWILMDTSQVGLMKYHIIMGRDFDPRMGTDAQKAVIINEAAARKLGWTDNPLGKKIDFDIELDGTARYHTKVVGVVKDFHYVSLHNEIEPLLFFLQDRPGYYLTIKTDGINNQNVIDHAGKVWATLGSQNPFEFRFLEQNMLEMYSAEKKTASIFRISGILSIFIALLGLLGLSSFVTERRSREIGIRKIMGAPNNIIMRMLYREFTVLVAIAFLIAAPAGTWLLQQWLANFAFHIPISWDIYLLSGMLALSIALLTTSWHTWKAAVSIPAEAIKYE